jgi:probable rRNA maturation factor
VNETDSGTGERPSYQVEIHVDPSEQPPHFSDLDRGAIEDLVRFVLSREGISAAMVGVVFCGDKRMAELNERWLGHRGPTDVITFDLRTEEDRGGGSSRGPSVLEGEIYVDLSQAARQAPSFEASIDEEVRRLVIHGVLHLVGFEDAGRAEQAIHMRNHQEELVRAWTRPVLELR